MVLKRIGVLSCGSVTGVLYALLGLLFGGIFTLASLFGAALGMSEGADGAWMGALVGIGAVIFFPILYGIFGFLGGILIAFAYNLTASITGGVELDLQ